MANFITTDTELQSVANAIRTKGGTSNQLEYPTGFVSAIQNIPSGGGVDPSYLTYEGDLSYFNYGGHFTPILQTNKSSVSIPEVTTFKYFMGDQPDWSSVNPDWNDWSWLVINIPYNQMITNIFYGTGNSFITKLPKIRIINDSGDRAITLGSSAFYNLIRVKDLDGVFPHSNCLSIPANGNISYAFYNMWCLRSFPDEIWWKNPDDNNKPQAGTSYSYWFYSCQCLDKIENLPILTGSSTASGAFTNFLNYGNRLNKITFATNNRTPYDINITRNLSWNLQYAGYVNTGVNLENLGIPTGKKVTDQASYELLKNDPDWWTDNSMYSRFNHDSAVALINSLPNNTNSTYKVTIQLKGSNGSATDGGAINTLTAEEIAVATNKNWIISIL